MKTPSEDIQNANIKSPRIKKRLSQVLDGLTKHPAGSILEAMGDRHQAKAAYRMLSNQRFEIGEVKKA